MMRQLFLLECLSLSPSSAASTRNGTVGTAARMTTQATRALTTATSSSSSSRIQSTNFQQRQIYQMLFLQSSRMGSSFRRFSTFQSSLLDPSLVTVTNTTSQTSNSSSSSFTSLMTDLERQEATALVDSMLAHTHSLMTKQEPNEQQQQQQLFPIHHVLAFSGCVDSSLVAALLHQIASGTKATRATSTSSTCMQLHYEHNLHHPPHHKVTAVLGLSEAVPDDQIALAEQIAQHIGIHFVQLQTTEGTDPTYLANAGQACYACKTHLYQTIQTIAHHYNHHHSNSRNNNNNNEINNSPMTVATVRLYNGTNADVPNWNYAASPCLRSRLAIGVPATHQHLKRIQRAEQFVKQQLSFFVSQSQAQAQQVGLSLSSVTNASVSVSASSQQQRQQHYSSSTSTSSSWDEHTSNLRVRLLTNNQACIEVDDDHVNTVAALLSSSSLSSSSATADPDGSSSSVSSSSSPACWQTYFVQTLGFSSVTVRPFKSGSVAATASAAIPKVGEQQQQKEKEQDSNNDNDSSPSAIESIA